MHIPRERTGSPVGEKFILFNYARTIYLADGSFSELPELLANMVGGFPEQVKQYVLLCSLAANNYSISTSDELDKIYSVFGLVCQFRHPQSDPPMHPDYNQSVEDVHVSFSSSIFHKAPRMLLL